MTMTWNYWAAIALAFIGSILLAWKRQYNFWSFLLGELVAILIWMHV